MFVSRVCGPPRQWAPPPHLNTPSKLTLAEGMVAVAVVGETDDDGSTTSYGNSTKRPRRTAHRLSHSCIPSSKRMQYYG